MSNLMTLSLIVSDSVTLAMFSRYVVNQYCFLFDGIIGCRRDIPVARATNLLILMHLLYLMLPGAGCPGVG